MVMPFHDVCRFRNSAYGSSADCAVSSRCSSCATGWLCHALLLCAAVHLCKATKEMSDQNDVLFGSANNHSVPRTRSRTKFFGARSHRGDIITCSRHKPEEPLVNNVLAQLFLSHGHFVNLCRPAFAAGLACTSVGCLPACVFLSLHSFHYLLSTICYLLPTLWHVACVLSALFRISYFVFRSVTFV